MVSRSEEIRNLSRKGPLDIENPSVRVTDKLPVEAREPETRRINCPICDEDISARAKKCRHCGETLDPELRAREEQRAAGHPVPPAHARRKNKVVAFALAWLLGGLGAHKFYLERNTQGVLYLLFCWTLIPVVLAFIEGLIYITMDEERFWEKYG